MALRASGAWAAPLFVVSVWHILENDLRLGRAAGAFGRLPPVAWDSLQARSLILCGAVLAISLATPEAAEFLGLRPLVSLSLVDIFAVVTGYHLLVWLQLAVRRARWDAPRARRRQLSLFLLHLACGGGCLAAAASGVPWLRSLATNPAIYLYWSALHALQTAWLRSRPASLLPSPRPEALS